MKMDVMCMSWRCVLLAAVSLSEMMQLIAATAAEKRLFSKLFDDDKYDTRVRPTSNVRRPLEVAMQYWLLSMEDLNERFQQMTAYGWLQMVWTDEYLKWNSSEFDDTKIIVTPVKNIWYPDLIIRNSASEAYGDFLDHEKFRVIIHENGTVTYFTAGKTVTSCALDLTYYPFDIQACYIHIDSWTYPEHKVKIVNMSNHLNIRFYRENGQWELAETRVIVEREVFETELEFTKLMFVLYLRRKPLFYCMVLVFPVTLMSFLVLLAFFLPAEASEKISLEITVILSFSVFQLLIADNMPKTSDYVPVMAVYVTCVMMMASMSLVCTIIVLQFHHHIPTRRPPRWLKTLTEKYIARYLCMQPEAEPSRTPDVSNHNQAARRLATSKSANPLDRSFRKNESSLETVCANNYNTQRELSDPVVLQTMTSLSELATTVVDHIDRDGEREAVHAEWARIGRIFDRLFAVVFLTATAGACVVLLGIYPLFGDFEIEPKRIS